MKRLFKFFCMMAAIVVGQSAWAADEELVVVNQTWTGTQLNSINAANQFEKTTDDGLLVVTMGSYTHKAAYTETLDAATTWERVTLGHVDKNETNNCYIRWKATEEGYASYVGKVTLDAKMPGNDGYFQMGDSAEVSLAYLPVQSWTSYPHFNADPTITSFPFYFRGGADRTCALGLADCKEYGKGAAIGQIELMYAIRPLAPEYLNKEMLVTVDTNKIHWYVLKDQVKYNQKFDGTIKFDVELTGKIPSRDAKYLFWNEDHSAFYMLKPMSFKIKAYIEKKDGAYVASEVTTWDITSKYPDLSVETPQIFYYVDDQWVRDVNADNENYVDFYVTNPVEHFVEYVCADQSKVDTLQKTTNCVDYQESLRARHDYFNFFRREMGSDVIELQIGAAGPSKLRLNAIGLELNRVPFLLDSEEMFKSLQNREEFGGDTMSAGWDSNWKDADEKQGVPNVVRFQGANIFRMDDPRVYEIHFLGVPDSLFYEYGNAVTNEDNGRLKVHWSADGKTWTEVRGTIKGPRQPSKGGQFFDAQKLDRSAQYLRFIYSTAQNAGYVRNIKVTTVKQLDILPQDTLVNFGQYKRDPSAKPVVKQDSLSWINLAPELVFNVDAPFSADGRIPVRPDKFDTIRSHNKFNIRLSLDTVGEFTKRLQVASMDVAQPMAAYVTLNAKVIYDTEDMFAKVNGQDMDTLNYGDTALITIVDKLGTKLFYHDSLKISYEYDATKLSIDENGVVRNLCVGIDTIVVNAEANSFVPGGWSDTLYIDVREREADSIYFAFDSEDEIAVHDTLRIAALDTVAEMVYWASDSEALTQFDNNTIVLGSKTFVHEDDSLIIYAKAKRTCEHFERIDSIKVRVRGIVTPEFNPDYDWENNVFGGDTIENPLLVHQEDGMKTINNEVNIAYEYSIPEVVVDTVDGFWYLRRSTSDSLHVKATVTSDSIKTAVIDIKFLVREYEVDIIYPTIDAERGWYVGDTLYHKDFHAIATNRDGRDLADRVIWTKTKYEDLDATILENGDIILDSLNVKLNVCVDTLFVKQECQDTTYNVQPAKLAYWEFPGAAPTDSIFVVGDSILVDSLVVLDIFNRNIDKYVRYDFSYVPSSFAHHSNATGLSRMGDYIVLDENGLDTNAVDTVISHICGGLVEDTTFRDRLLVAPVYADSIVLSPMEYTVGDTLCVNSIKALDKKGNDVTRYSNFVFTFAPDVAHRTSDSTIVLDKAGDAIRLRIVAKRNLSMHQGAFVKYVKVNPVRVAEVTYPGPYKVFDKYPTDSVRLFDAKGRDITNYATIEFTYDGNPVSGQFMLEKAGDHVLSMAISGNVADTTINETVTVGKYDKAQVIFKKKPFVVAEDVNLYRFYLADADKKAIAKSYYTFSYETDGNAHLDEDTTMLTLDNLQTTFKVYVNSADIELAESAAFASFDIEAAPATAVRLEFPDRQFLVTEGFAVAEIKVFNAQGKDITEYAKDEFTKFEFAPKANAKMNEAKDSIYFEKAGEVKISTTLGTTLVNDTTLENKMYAHQLTVDSIIFPDRDYMVADTVYASEFRALADDVDVTSYVKDIVLSIGYGDGHVINKGAAVILDKKGRVKLTAEVLGRSNSEVYEQSAWIDVAPVVPDSFTLDKDAYIVMDTIETKAIHFFKGELDITQYVTATYEFDNTAATEIGSKIVLDKSGDFQLMAIAWGNATGSVSRTVPVSKFQNAMIKNSKEDANFVVGDALTPADFYLVDKDDESKVLNPRYYEFVLDSAKNKTHMDGKNVVFDVKSDDVPVSAKLNAENSEIEAAQYDKIYEIGLMIIDEVIFPKPSYVVGDSIAISELILKSKGQDVTETYAKDAKWIFEFGPDKEISAKVANGYIYLKRPGNITVTSTIMKDNVIGVSTITNTVFVDLLTPDRIEFPDEEFTVGDEVMTSQFRVFVGERDITEFADVTLSIDPRDGHYIENGIVLDQKGQVRVFATVGGVLGVKPLTENDYLTVKAIKADSVENLPKTATVMDMVNTKNLVITSEGVDINRYADNVEFSFSPEGIAKQEGDMILFQKSGKVTVTLTVSGNAEGTINQDIEVAKYENVELNFKGGAYFVADEVKPSDFKLIDKANGKEVVFDYALTIEAESGKTSQPEENIVLDGAGMVTVNVKLNDNEQVSVADQSFDISVSPAKASFVKYADGPYIVGNKMNVSNFQVFDSIGRDITTYATGAFGGIKFTPENAKFDKASGDVTFVSKGTTNVTAFLNNADVQGKTDGIQTVWSIDQMKATAATFQAAPYYVGDTLLLSKVAIFNGDKDITEEADPFFIILDKEAGHFLSNGDLVFDKANEQYAFKIATKGYKNVDTVAFGFNIKVQPRQIARIVLPYDNRQVLDSLNTEDIKYYDKNGNVINNYATDVTITLSGSKADWAGKQIVFYEKGTATLNFVVKGNAETVGAFSNDVIVNKNTTAKIDAPKAEFYYVGDEVKLSDFKLLDKNDKAFDAAYSLSFDIDSKYGRKLDENTIVIDTLDAQITVKAEGEVNISTFTFDPEIKPCVVNRVVFPEGRYIVGDSIKIADLKLLDATNRDLTRYAEYREFVFDPFSADTASIEKGYIYFLQPGKATVSTTVGKSKMAVVTLFNEIYVEQAAADSVGLKNNVRVVGDTLDIAEFDVYDKNGNLITKYSDLQFDFDADAAHFVVAGLMNKIILDKAGEGVIRIIVDGRQGVAQQTKTPVLKINPVEIAKVKINGTYKVTDMITTAAVQAWAENGLDVTRYIGVKAYTFDEGVAHAEGEGYIIDKSGKQYVTVKLTGDNVVDTTYVIEMNFNKCEAFRVEFPENAKMEYRVGDTIKVKDFVVYDEDGNDITKYADLSFTSDPADGIEWKAAEGIIVVMDKTGNLKLNVVIGKDNAGHVVPNTFSETYFVRHNITKTEVYDLLERIWDDVLAVSDVDGKFVEYVWYRDEQVIFGQSAQIYYAQAADYDGKEHVYYVIASDAKGNEYLIKEKTYTFTLDQAPARKSVSIKSATLLDAAANYTIEASHDGEVAVSNSNGVGMRRFNVQAGKNTAIAPASSGVYVLYFTTVDGETATQKIIVK